MISFIVIIFIDCWETHIMHPDHAHLPVFHTHLPSPMISSPSKFLCCSFIVFRKTYSLINFFLLNGALFWVKVFLRQHEHAQTLPWTNTWAWPLHDTLSSKELVCTVVFLKRWVMIWSSFFGDYINVTSHRLYTFVRDGILHNLSSSWQEY